jgi:hypothetical protein
LLVKSDVALEWAEADVTTTTTTAPPPPPPRPKAKPAYVAPTAVAPTPVAPTAGASGVWACIRQHESGGDYADDTGNGYYGAYQFTLGTWESLGFSGLPSDASPATQDAAAAELQARSGWGQWPVTSIACGV